VIISTSRIPALDAYRAAMMLLGLVLHSAVFTTTYAPVKTEFGENLLDLLYDFIHTFRMPAFFLISGYFAALLFEKYGAGGLFSNRLKRILIPLLIFWPVVSLLFQLVFELNQSDLVLPAEQDYVEFYHLWFLSYLIYLNIFMIFLVKISGKVFLKQIKIFNLKAVQLLLFTLATILLALIPNTLETDGSIRTASQISPDYSMLTFYLIIFVLGWLSYHNSELINNFRKFWYLFLIVGAVGYFAHLATGEQLDFDYRIVYFGASLSLSFGLLGLSMKLIQTHNPALSYVASASYWIYIIHLPIVLLGIALLEQFQLNLFFRFHLVLAFTALISVLSYQLLVRGKPIGRLLGERISK
jgi:glucans biosynthesis protein C